MSLPTLSHAACLLSCRYEGRCGLPTNFDSSYCYALGHGSGALLQSGKTGLITSVCLLVMLCQILMRHICTVHCKFCKDTDRKTGTSVNNLNVTSQYSSVLCKILYLFCSYRKVGKKSWLFCSYCKVDTKVMSYSDA